MAKKQRTLHIITEILAIPVGIFLLWAAFTQPVDRWVAIMFGIIGAGNLLIDGYMITTWFKKR